MTMTHRIPTCLPWANLAVAGLIMTAASSAAAAHPPCNGQAMALLASQQPDKPPLGQTDSTTWTLQREGAYLFIKGTVGASSGVFLLDTGTPFPFILNNHRIPLKLDDYLCTGKAGSGQDMVFYRHANIGPIRLSEQDLGTLNWLPSADISFLTNMSRGGIRHDVLGFAGLPLLRAHEFVFDHRANTLTLHRMDAQGRVAAPHYASQDVIASLAFTLPAGQHVPSITLNWDGVIIEGKLDTGNPGTLTLTPAAQRKLRNAGHLRQENGSYTLHGLNYRGTPLIASASTLKVGSANVLGLGQNLLAHYRSVWNFRQQTVILLKP